MVNRNPPPLIEVDVVLILNERNLNRWWKRSYITEIRAELAAIGRLDLIQSLGLRARQKTPWTTQFIVLRLPLVLLDTYKFKWDFDEFLLRFPGAVAYILILLNIDLAEWKRPNGPWRKNFSKVLSKISETTPRVEGQLRIGLATKDEGVYRPLIAALDFLIYPELPNFSSLEANGGMVDGIRFVPDVSNDPDSWRRDVAGLLRLGNGSGVVVQQEQPPPPPGQRLLQRMQKHQYRARSLSLQRLRSTTRRNRRNRSSNSSHNSSRNDDDDDDDDDGTENSRGIVSPSEASARLAWKGPEGDVHRQAYNLERQQRRNNEESSADDYERDTDDETPGNGNLNDVGRNFFNESEASIDRGINGDDDVDENSSDEAGDIIMLSPEEQRQGGLYIGAFLRVVTGGDDLLQHQQEIAAMLDGNSTAAAVAQTEDSSTNSSNEGDDHDKSRDGCPRLLTIQQKVEGEVKKAASSLTSFMVSALEKNERNLKKTTDELFARTNEVTSVRRQLDETKKETERVVDQLRTQLDAKDQELNRLDSELGVTKEELKTKTEWNALQKADIERQKMAHSEEMKAVNSKLNTKSDEAANLRSRLSKKKEEFVALETTNKDLGKDLAARAATILVKDAEITRMGQSIHDKDADITRMGQSIHDKNAEIARLGQMIEAISQFADNKNKQARNNNQE